MPGLAASAGQLPGLRRTPPAGARYPRMGPVSRLLAYSRRRPGWCPFPAVKVLLLPPQASRKALKTAILVFPYPRRNLPKAGSHAHFIGVIHGFTHRVPVGCQCKLENT